MNDATINKPRRGRRTARPANPPEPPVSLKAPGKLDQIETLLRRDQGASIAEMMAATGWQQHSVRGAMAGALKKRGLTIASEKVEGDAALPRRSRMMMCADVEGEVVAIEQLDLEGLRLLWARHYGPPPPLRSVPIMRMLLAWRMQAAVHGGIDQQTRRMLARKGRLKAEGLELGIGARLTRSWKGREVEVVVEAQGFRCNGELYPSLSAAATAIAGTRWNGPRFFGLR